MAGERIIKDVITYCVMGLKPTKKTQEKLPSTGKTGSKDSEPAIDTAFEDIDPAEFFDPEEFGYKRLQSGLVDEHRPRS